MFEIVACLDCCACGRVGVREPWANRIATEPRRERSYVGDVGVCRSGRAGPLRSCGNRDRTYETWLVRRLGLGRWCLLGFAVPKASHDHVRAKCYSGEIRLTQAKRGTSQWQQRGAMTQEGRPIGQVWTRFPRASQPTKRFAAYFRREDPGACNFIPIPSAIVPSSQPSTLCPRASPSQPRSPSSPARPPRLTLDSV